MKNNFKLFLIMFKIGLFTFGGGYAMLSLIENEFVNKRKWIEHDEFINMVAIAESSPGPIAINSATYLGYKQGKFLGSLFATLGVVLPSFIIIFIISLIFRKFLEIEFIANAFKGIQACVVFLIIYTGIKMFIKLKKNVFNITMFTLTSIIILVFGLFAIKFSSIYYILIGGFLGLIIYLISSSITNNQKENKEENK